MGIGALLGNNDKGNCGIFQRMISMKFKDINNNNFFIKKK